MGFEGCGVGAVMVTLDRGGIHEVEFDEPDPTFADECPVSVPHILLGSGMGCVQRVKHIRLLVPDVANRDRISLGIVHQPVLVVLVDPSPARHLKRRRPYAECQPLSDKVMPDKPQTIRKLRCIRSCIFPAGVLITFINLEISIT